MPKSIIVDSYRKLALITVFGIASWVGSTSAQEAFPFPTRSSDLINNAWWNVSNSHHPSHARDFNVARKAGSEFSHLDADGGSENSDRNSFGIPHYAPFDGEIVSCWRNHPENPGPSNVHEERCCNGNCSISCDSDQCPASASCRITRSGNHVGIMRPNGDTFLLAHLKSDTIPKNLCPFSATFMVDSRDKPGDELPRESYLRLCDNGESRVSDDCFVDRPQVKRGDFVGRSGNTGASSGPHSHLHIINLTENSAGFMVRTGNIEPMDLGYGWHMKRATDAIWKMLDGNNTDLDEKDLIHASPYLRRASNSAGAIKDTATLFLSGNRAVTASVASSDNSLKLISWDLFGAEGLSRKHDIEAGATKQVDLSEPSSNIVLAAIRQQDNTLKMKAYFVAALGNFVHLDDHTAGEISALDMATLPGVDRKAVTAVRTESGDLKIIVWDVKNDKIVRLASHDAGAVTALAVSRAKAFNGVFVAVRDGNGELKIIPFVISANGELIDRKDSVSAGKIGTAIDVAPLANGVAVAVKDEDGKLRLITWGVRNDGDIANRRETALAGSIKEINLMPTPHGGSNLTAVVRGSDDRLYLIGWTVNDNGTALRRIGSSRAGDASRISADAVSSSVTGSPSHDLIMTSMRDSDGDLRLITWDTNIGDPG